MHDMRNIVKNSVIKELTVHARHKMSIRSWLYFAYRNFDNNFLFFL